MPRTSLTIPTSDFVTTTLNGALTAGATSATIGTGLGLPATNGILHLDYDSTSIVGADNGPEVITYTAYDDSTGAVTGITRGAAGTTGVVHANGASVQCAPSTLLLNNLSDLIANNNNWVLGSDLATDAALLGSAIKTNLSDTHSTTLTDLTDMSVAVTVPSGGRSLRITAKLTINNATANDVASIYIRKSSTTLQTFRYNTVTNGRDVDICFSHFISAPSSGAHTYKLSSQTTTGTGNVTYKSSSTSPALLLVELV